MSSKIPPKPPPALAHLSLPPSKAPASGSAARGPRRPVVRRGMPRPDAAEAEGAPSVLAEGEADHMASGGGHDAPGYSLLAEGHAGPPGQRGGAGLGLPPPGPARRPGPHPLAPLGPKSAGVATGSSSAPDSRLRHPVAQAVLQRYSQASPERKRALDGVWAQLGPADGEDRG